jgi:hypothetical protein
MSLEGREAGPMTPARKELLAFVEAWTYPILGNEDRVVLEHLFGQARSLARDVAVGAGDAPEFAGMADILQLR